MEVGERANLVDLGEIPGVAGRVEGRQAVAARQADVGGQVVGAQRYLPMAASDSQLKMEILYSPPI